MSEQQNKVNIFHDPTTIVLSGGGMNGFNILGALSYLHDKNYLQNVSTYIGTSVGGMIGYCLILGYTPIEIILYLQKNKVLKSINSFNIISMLQGGGAISFMPFQTHLEKMTIEKVGQFFTLGDLKDKLKKRLVVCTYNVTTNEVEYLTPETHPSLPCITAIRMTSNLPFVFEDFKYTGSYYIDGGVYDNFPILQADMSEKVLGISLDPKNKYVKEDQETNIVEYIFHLISIPAYKEIENKIKTAEDNGCSIIKLSKKNKVSKLIDFAMDIRECLDMFSDGYHDAKIFFED